MAIEHRRTTACTRCSKWLHEAALVVRACPAAAVMLLGFAGIMSQNHSTQARVSALCWLNAVPLILSSALCSCLSSWSWLAWATPSGSPTATFSSRCATWSRYPVLHCPVMLCDAVRHIVMV